MATLQKMSEQEMQALAETLIGMPVNKARGHVRRLDPAARLDLLRVAVGSELRTRFSLPNQGVMVTLVEKDRQVEFTDDDLAVDFQARGRFEPEFVEARVEPLG